ncbi:hypothetical protein AAFC00_006184 [Neodothiora populina]|uniref:2,5-diamino-6-ribosylamino-4(3H)-pyrimidinone 5'-phosphate reductase n=1 Tax=Neodothiora populina TaxID=2781224 RepID=A0ABR3P4C3_9PEZI
MTTRDELDYPEQDRGFLESFLPSQRVPRGSRVDASLPWVTLTFATSLDSALSIAPGVQTALSGPRSKAMTHYLRSRHDAILVGVGTAIADNPSLNCRLTGVGGYGGEDLVGQPRPIVIDPQGRWQLNENTKILNLARQGRGKAPWVITTRAPRTDAVNLLQQVGGQFVVIDSNQRGEPTADLGWQDILQHIRSMGVESIMIEGGGGVINALLSPNNAALVSSVIVTIAPTWLGQGGVVVSPARPETRSKLPVARLKQTVWQQLGDDCVLCGAME